MVKKWGSNGQNLKKISRKWRGSIPKFSPSIGQKSIFRCHFIQSVKDGIQIQVQNINNESLHHFI